MGPMLSNTSAVATRLPWYSSLAMHFCPIRYLDPPTGTQKHGSDREGGRLYAYQRGHMQAAGSLLSAGVRSSMCAGNFNKVEMEWMNGLTYGWMARMVSRCAGFGSG